MHVLLVEDDELVRMCLAEMLADAGIGVTEAFSAERALGIAEAAAAARPDVLLTDVNLGPGMDGIALAAEAHRRWPGVRVVLISGVAANLIGRCLHPSDRFLPKPFSTDALLRAVHARTSDAASCPGPGDA